MVIEGLLGRENARRLIARVQGHKAGFSEAELVQTHFRSRPGPGVMIDVGAHFGESFAPYLERGWRVLAFEPDHANRRRLLQNRTAGSLQVFTEALSDREVDAAPFYTSEESDGISGLSAFHPSHRESDRVRVSTLAKMLAEHPLGRLDFLKVDTEGYDLFVLKGYPWASGPSPEAVLCEFEDRKTIPLGYDFRVLGDYLVERGFEVYLSEWYPVVRYGVRHRWRCCEKYPCCLRDPSGWGNFVAFRPGLDLTPVRRYLKSCAETQEK